jgi:hypothetical protein
VDHPGVVRVFDFLANDLHGGPQRVKVLDFGLARIAARERITQTGRNRSGAELRT